MHRSYDPTCFPRLLAIEERHFWFVARNRIIGTLVRQIADGLPPGYRVLEIGCGTGNTLRVLNQACTDGVVVGMDLFMEALEHTRRRVNCSLVQGDACNLPFNAKFDLIGLFDVLEHLTDDAAVLDGLHAVLAPGGALLLTVPAHTSLWSYFDEMSHHRRRYELTELEDKLLKAGFCIEYSTEYMTTLFPLVWIGRRLTALFARRPKYAVEHMNELAARELRIMPAVNKLLIWLLAGEVDAVARRRKLSRGTSLVAIARRRSSACG